MGLRLFVSCTTGWIRIGTCKPFYHSPHTSLTRCQRDQSLIAIAGDAGNSLSMRSVKGRNALQGVLIKRIGQDLLGYPVQIAIDAKGGAAQGTRQYVCIRATQRIALLT